MSETQKLITFKEALDILPVSQVTFYRMLEDRGSEIPHYRIGNQYFFNPDELLAYFKKGIDHQENKMEE